MMKRDVLSTVSRTKQSFREESDINKIVARARSGAAVTHMARGIPRYMDVSEVGDYKGALDMLRSMDAFFAKLPAKVRLAFGNDPAELLDAVETTEGRRKLEELGLVSKIPDAVPFEETVTRNADGTFAKEGRPGSPADPVHS